MPCSHTNEIDNLTSQKQDEVELLSEDMGKLETWITSQWERVRREDGSADLAAIQGEHWQKKQQNGNCVC